MDNVIKVNFTGPNRGKIFSRGKVPNRRYGALLIRKSDRAIAIGIVVTDVDIEVWSEENGYEIVKSFRLNKEPSSTEKTRLGFSNRYGV